MNMNFQKQLDALISKNPTKLQAPSMFGFKNLTTALPKAIPGYTYPSQTIFDSIKHSSTSSNVMYILAAIFVVMVILTAIHFFVNPIFPGWLVGTSTLPGMDDSKLFWASRNDFPTSIVASNLPLSMAYNYTLMIDMQIDNPPVRIGQSRVMLNRGGVVDTAKELDYQSTKGLKGLITTLITGGFNFAIYFDPNSTDLNITVGTQDGRQSPPTTSNETILLPNFPIQKSVRLTLVLNERTVEIYINGYLYKIKQFAGALDKSQLGGDIHGPISNIIGTSISPSKIPFGRVQNLRIWNRTLMSSEIRSYGSGAAFSEVGQSDTCVS